MQKVKDFWINSYKSDKIAFGFELISFVFTVMASLTLAFNAKDPNMLDYISVLFCRIGYTMLRGCTQRRGMGHVTNRILCCY